MSTAALPREPVIVPVRLLPAPLSARARVFLDDVHSFRGLAILFIVAGHTLFLFDWSASPILYKLLSKLLINGTTFFVFIAGYLFQHLSGGFQYSRFLQRKFANVFLPYLIISIPAVVVYYLAHPTASPSNGYPAESNIFSIIIGCYLTGSHSGSYWFIPFIAVYYAFSPLFVSLDRRPVFHLVLPATLLLSLCVPRGDFLHNLVHFFGFYLLGMYYSHHRHWVRNQVARVQVFLVLTVLGALLGPVIAFMALGTEPLHWALGSLYPTVSHACNTVQKLSLCLLFLFWLKSLPPSLGRPLSRYADLSFGIFFVHDYVLRIVHHWLPILASVVRSAIYGGGETLRESQALALPGSLLSMIVFVPLVFFLSAAIVEIARNLLGKDSRMVIGA